jgi:hypothetical protein
MQTILIFFEKVSKIEQYLRLFMKIHSPRLPGLEMHKEKKIIVFSSGSHGLVSTKVHE